MSAQEFSNTEWRLEYFAPDPLDGNPRWKKVYRPNTKMNIMDHIKFWRVQGFDYRLVHIPTGNIVPGELLL